MNYDRFINKSSARRQDSALRNLPKLYAAAPPGTVFIGGGMPNINTFPFARVDVALKDGINIPVEGKLLEQALQYQPTQGFAPLVKQLKELQTREHKLAADFWDKNELLVTTGSLDGICRTFDMCLVDGDPVLYQDPSFSGVADALKAYDTRLIAIEQDAFGIRPDKLRAALQAEGTPQEIRSKKTGVPKLLYVNPTGSNPSGITIPTDRKKEIYKLACEYDFLIIEDDPYYFLHFGEESPVSFLSLDTEGRVLRYDSLSKVLSSGLRLGFMTSPKQISERIELHTQVSTMHTSGLPQVIISSLISAWGFDRLNEHFKSIQDFYRGQRDAMLAAANKHITGLAEWTVPTGGMFLWIRVLGVDDVTQMILEGGTKGGFIAVSGGQLMANSKAPCPYIRASFSSASPADFDLGFSRLAKMIIVEQKKQNKK